MWKHPRRGSALFSLLLILAGLVPVLPASAAAPAADPAPGQPTAPAATPAAPGTAPPAAPPAGSEPRSFTVYFPDQDREERQAVAAARAPRPARPQETPVGLLTLIGLLIAGVLLGRRVLSPQCRRCRTKMSTLEPREEGSVQPGIQVLSCPACGEVARRKHRLYFVRNARCPDCGAPTRVWRPTVVERPGYLTWGVLRLDDECASCTHRASAEYAVPPLEAPARPRPRTTTT